jgi:hypothetical protein
LADQNIIAKKEKRLHELEALFPKAKTDADKDKIRKLWVVTKNELNDLKLPSSRTPQTSFGDNISDEEMDSEFDDETGEELDAEGNPILSEEDASEEQTASANDNLAKAEVENIQQNEPGFEENTQKGQEGLASPAGAAADTQSKAPEAAPPAKPETNDKAAGGKALDAGGKGTGTAGAGAAAGGAEGAANGMKAAAQKPAEKPAGSDENTSTSGQGIADRAKQSIAEAREKLKQYAAKAKDSAKKALTKAGMKVFWKWAGPYILGALAILAIAGIAFALFASLFTTGNTGTTGATYVQAVDPIKDKDWLGRLLKYSGDSEINTKTSADTIAIVRKALTDIQADTTLPESTRGMATTALTDLASFENAATDAIKKTAATKLISSITALKNVYLACSGLYTNDLFKFSYADEKTALIKTGKLATDLKRPSDGKHFFNPAKPLNPKLCNLLVLMSDATTGLDRSKFKGDPGEFIDLSFRGTHTKFVAGSSTNISSHYCGNGVDMNYTHGKNVADSILAAEMKRWIWANEAVLKKSKIWPDELYGGPPMTNQIDDSKITSAQIDTNDHVHLGFGGCPGD